MPRARTQKRHVRKLLQSKGLGASTKQSTRGRKSAKPAEVERTGGGTTATKRSKPAKRAKATKPSVMPPAAPALAARIVEVKPPGVRERPPYPVDALPATLRDFVESAVELNGVDPAAVAVPALIAAMAAIGNSVRCEMHVDWREPMAAICALLGYSGDGKTAIIGSLSSIIADVEDCMKGHAHAVDADGLPESNLMVTNSVSTARLIELMKEQPRGLIFLRDELAALFAGASSAAAKEREAILLEATEGRTHRKHVVTKKEDSDGPPPVLLLSLVGGVQPDIYAAIMRANGRLGSGLAARIWHVCPPRRLRCYSIPAKEVAQRRLGVEDRLRKILVRLRTIRFDGLKWSVVHCTDEARQRVIDFANAQEAAIAPLCDASVEKSMRSKARGWVVRVACTLALLRAAEGAEARAADLQKTHANDVEALHSAEVGLAKAVSDVFGTAVHAAESMLREQGDSYDLEDASDAIDMDDPQETPGLRVLGDLERRCIPGDEPLDARDVKVTLDDVESAIHVVTWQLEESARVLHELDLEVEDSEIVRLDALARAALATAKRQDMMTPYEFAAATNASVAEAKEKLARLVAEKRWEPCYPPVSANGGRPSRHYRRRSSAA